MGSIFARGLDIVDRAGADEDEKTRVEMGKNAADFEAGVEDCSFGGFRDGALFFKEDGWENDGGALNA